MQGKILIIDGISTNRIVLKVKLTTAFYQVVQAGTLRDALKLVQSEQPDLIITAINLPDRTSAQLCDHLRASAKTANLPVLAIGSMPDTVTRLATLQAGVFEVMKKPVNEMLLLGRVRSMIRSYHKIVKRQMRDETACALGLAEVPAEFVQSARVSLIGTKAASLHGWARHLKAHIRAAYAVTLLPDAMAALHSEPPPDAVVLTLPDDGIQNENCLRLISALRARALTRDVALLVLQNTPDPIRATSALDMGADDVMTDGFDAPKLCLRVNELLKRKRYMIK